MPKLNKITITGFRGIFAKLEIDLRSGGAPQSVILYGANGTGKSSITDAWEWLTTDKIQHLAREGAEEAAYPHMAAAVGTTRVDAEFSDAAIGQVGLQFDHKRKTMPYVHGNLSAVRRLLTHPCHIRYADLTRFVFLRKSERYDTLAELMGFVPQMEYQKALRRVETEFRNDLYSRHRLLEAAEVEFQQHFTSQSTDAEAAFASMVQVCAAHGLQTAPNATDIAASAEALKAAVTSDPNAKKLADLQTLETAIRLSKAPSDLSSTIASVRTAVAQLKAEQTQQLHDPLLVPLFKSAAAILAETPATGVCPLCHREFPGDLQAHVQTELARLSHLQNLLDSLSEARTTLSTTLASHGGLVAAFEEAVEPVPQDLLVEVATTFRDQARLMDECVGKARELMNFDTTRLPENIVADLQTLERGASQADSDFTVAKNALLRQVEQRKTALQKDAGRVKLVADQQFVTNGLKHCRTVEQRQGSVESAQKVAANLAMIVNDFMQSCIADVQQRFDEISDKVKTFFAVLEKDTTGLGEPRMQLLPDQDRSVILEVEFHGKPIRPAHKYLSESQLNSFGLAVFLASATHFNKQCPFLILDDVVNSFDAYKRPQLIELIRQHLTSQQILLMTHDRFWRDLLHRSLPNWKRINFTNYVFGVGPTCSPAKNALERVEEALERDEAEEASGIFARYLEDSIQDICEAFEVEVKFNRRGEHTLDPLIDRLRVRVREKLGPDHPLSRVLTQMFEDNAYRNWSIHCKNPEISIHAAEIRTVLGHWKAIWAIVQCQDCFAISRCDSKGGGFRCSCGTTHLTKAVTN